MVVCPNADQQGVRAEAQAAHAKWLERSRASRLKRKTAAKEPASAYAGMSKADKQLVMNDAIAWRLELQVMLQRSLTAR